MMPEYAALRDVNWSVCLCVHSRSLIELAVYQCEQIFQEITIIKVGVSTEGSRFSLVCPFACVMRPSGTKAEKYGVKHALLFTINLHLPCLWGVHCSVSINKSRASMSYIDLHTGCPGTELQETAVGILSLFFLIWCQPLLNSSDLWEIDSPPN